MELNHVYLLSEAAPVLYTDCIVAFFLIDDTDLYFL